MNKEIILIPLIALMVIIVGLLSGCTDQKVSLIEKQQDDEFASWVLEISSTNLDYYDEMSSIFNSDISDGSEIFEAAINISSEWIEYLKSKSNEIINYNSLSEDMKNVYRDFSEVLIKLQKFCDYLRTSCQYTLDFNEDQADFYMSKAIDQFDESTTSLNHCRQALKMMGYI